MPNSQPASTDDLSVYELVQILLERHAETNGFEFVPVGDLRRLIGACVDHIHIAIHEGDLVVQEFANGL